LAPVAADCGVEDPGVDHGEDTLGGSGSKVNTEAMTRWLMYMIKFDFDLQ
jgi:hypothetical protein